MNTRSKALISILITVILFSFHVIISKVVVTQVPSMFVLFERMLIASIAFSPFFIKSKVWKKPKFANLAAISLLSTVNVVFFSWGIQYTSASASQLIYAAMPILTIIISVIFLKEKYSRRTILGVIIGLMGIIFTVYKSAVDKGGTISGGFTGNMAMVVAMFGWLNYIILSKKYSKFFKPSEIGSVSVFVSLVVSSILLLLQTNFGNLRVNITKEVIFSGIYLGFFGTFATYMLLQYAISHLSPLTVNLSSYLQPVTTAILAIILLGEVMTFSFLTGTIMVLTGVFFTATLEYYRKKGS